MMLHKLKGSGSKSSGNTVLAFGVFISSSNKGKYLCLAVVGLVAVLTVTYSIFVVLSYQQQFNDLTDKQNQVQTLLAQNKPVEAAPVSTGLTLDDLDRLMVARPESITYERIRMGVSVPIQVEGSAKDQIDIGNLVASASAIALPLSIRQVQADKDNGIRFEVRREQP